MAHLPLKSFDDICEMTKISFKKIVKSKVKEKALLFLKDLQKSHSKSKHLIYNDLNLQNYLKSDMTIKEKSFIFLAKSRMLDLKCNFKYGLTDLLCSKCRIEEENQEHLLSCTALVEKSVVNSEYIPQYDDIFSNDTKKLSMIGKILMIKFNLLKNDKTLCTNINLCAATVPQTVDKE